MKKGKLPLWILGYAAVILVIAVVINVAMGFSIPTNAGLTAPTWLGFWGSYLGGAIGCIPALLALYDNRREARLQHEESEKSRRLAAMPVISCENLSVSRFQTEPFSTLSAMVFLNQTVGLHNSFKSPDPRKYKEILAQIGDPYSRNIFLDFHNIGAAPAINISLSCLNIPQQRPLLIDSIGSKEKKTFLFCIQIPPDASEDHLAEYNIKITFSDIFGNYYTQIQPIICSLTSHGLCSISLPELVKK